MRKRTPYNPKKKQTEDAKTLRSIKTALPLVITLVLFAVLYVLVLKPDIPANKIKSSVIHSAELIETGSYRYDGSFGDDNRGIAAEYTGQKARSGDSEFRLRLKNDDDQFTSFETLHIGQNSYLRVSGVQNLATILGGITGAKVPDAPTLAVLSSAQDKWIEVNQSVLASIPCADYLPELEPILAGTNEDNYPYTLVNGPYRPKDDSEDKLYDMKFNESAPLLPGKFVDLGGCVEKNYAVQDDYRLRESGKVDQDSTAIVMKADPLSNTVKYISMKSVGQYFVMNIRDYGKDVSLSAPSNAISVGDFFNQLPQDQRERIAKYIVQ
jgi:hypothetical protein